MPRIPIFRLGHQAEERVPPRLASFAPTFLLEGLQVGVDNLRYDVHLSPRFVEQSRVHISRLLLRHGDLEGLIAAEAKQPSGPQFLHSKTISKSGSPEPADLKSLLTEMHVASLNHAKSEGKPVLDLLARAAILKFLRAELHSQFGQIVERSRLMLKGYEGVRQQKAIEYRERIAGFQVAKKIILRKTGQELFRTLREIEKETLGRTRRSIFGESEEEKYKLFQNPLIFTDDGSDTYLNAELYVMLGNFDRDIDRFWNARRVACDFLQSLKVDLGAEPDRTMDAWLNVPENAHELIGGGTPDSSTPEGRAQKERLEEWVSLLEREKLMEYVVASYEVVPLLAEYSPRINAQQLKNALISREERDRVEKMIADHGKLSSDALYAAVERVANYRSHERAKAGGRFLRDLMRYHRDLRQFETLNGIFDSINLISNAKLQELSALNGTLYQFLLKDEQKSGEAKILRHVIIKADVRDSSRLTKSLLEKDMNPASYFSLNFYDPVNKLLPKYGATKVFLEGDAIILAILEREGEAGLAVCRAAGLSREIIEIVHGYNQLLERSGLPGIELGIGISYQDSAPMYLMDGDQKIMISDALNESDRLSSCSRRVRKPMKAVQTPFHVYAFQTASAIEAEESPEDSIMKYNVNGIRLSEAAFHKMRAEISLHPLKLDLSDVKLQEEYCLWSALVPVGKDIFRRIVVRSGRTPHVDPGDFSRKQWTENWYYEVCSDPAIYSRLDASATAGK